MKVYRAAWLVAFAAAVLAGVGVGLARSPETLAGTFVAFAALTAISSHAADCYRQRRLRAPDRRLIGTALVGGAAAGAAVGLAGLLGVGVLALGMVLLAASPHVLPAYVRALTSVPVSMGAGLSAWMSPPACVSPQSAQTPAAPNLRLLTDQRLRGVWRASFLVLQRRPRSSEVAAIVEQRQRYLDEFERRNPRGFEAWLARGAWPSDIPGSCLRDVPTAGPGINWDELTRQQDS